VIGYPHDGPRQTPRTARLLRAMRAGQIGVWEWDFATDRITWSDTHEATWGFAPGTFPGTLAAFMATVHPDDREIVRLAAEHCRCGDSGVRQEYRIVRADGTVRWMLGTGSSIRNRAGRPIGMTGVSVDVTDYHLADDARRELQRQLADAQEEERRRISRELHDHMGQHLAALILGLETLKDSVANPRDRRRVQRLQALASALGSEVHDLALELRPTALDDLGLYSALRHYADQWSGRYDIPVDVHSNGLDRPRLPPAIETALYRIVQEGLTNVARHAHATRASVIVEQRNGIVQLILEDDGRGFPVDGVLNAPLSRGHLGVLGMRERAVLAGGTLDIESAPDRGTTLFVRVPVPGESAKAAGR